MHRRTLAATAVATCALLAVGVRVTAQNNPVGQGPSTRVATINDPDPLPFTRERLARLKAPPGFQVKVFAQNQGNVRIMHVRPNGDLYVTRRGAGDVVLYRDKNRDGVADGRTVVAENIPLVHGIAERDGLLYLFADTRVHTVKIRPDGTLGRPKVIIEDLPDSGQHTARTLAFGPDGLLYLNVGSTCNDCDEGNPENATMIQALPDGSARNVYARGLRHTIGFDWHPVTKQLWSMDMGSDWHGDNQPPEELNRVERGNHYGWPWCYADRQVDEFTVSQPPEGKAAFCSTTRSSVLTATAHSAPIDMQFYTGSMFPAEYKNDAFVTFRGSWNRSQPSGYKVVRVRYDSAGRPQAIEDFVTGWLVDDADSRPGQFGRVAGVAQWIDGSLLIAEDNNGVIYRVVYTGAK